jgi:hypothetical protein
MMPAAFAVVELVSAMARPATAADRNMRRVFIMVKRMAGGMAKLDRSALRRCMQNMPGTASCRGGGPGHKALKSEDFYPGPIFAANID